MSKSKKNLLYKINILYFLYYNLKTDANRESKNHVFLFNVKDNKYNRNREFEIPLRRRSAIHIESLF